VAVVGGQIYGALYFAPALFFLPDHAEGKAQTEIITVLPFWILVSIACYLLGRLGLGVLTFNDTKEAYVELMGQSEHGIDGAKRQLKERGVGTD